MTRRQVLHTAVACALLVGATGTAMPVRRGTKCKTELVRWNVPKWFWSADRVLDGIRHLMAHRNELNLLSETMSLDKSLLTARLLEEIYELPVTGSRLHGAARRFFGCWEKAVEAAGFSYQELQGFYGVLFWTDERMFSCIRFLLEAGVPVNDGSIQRDDSLSSRVLLFLFTGRWTTAQSLYVMARRRFGNWKIALERAGVDPELHRRYVKWEKALVIEAIQALRRGRVRLNVHAIMFDRSPRTHAILERVTGKRVNGVALHGAARVLFGSWDEALRAAGLEPSRIRLYQRRIWARALPGQVEVALRANGDGQLTRYLGRPPTTPDEDAAWKEMEQALSDRVDELPDKDQDLARELLELVLSGPVLTRRALALELSEALGEVITEERVQEILGRMATLWDEHDPS